MYTTLSINSCDTKDTCRNLRPVTSDAGSVLQPVGEPAIVADIPKSASILCTFRHNDGSRTLFYADGARLLAIDPDNQVSEIALLPVVPDCAVVCRNSIVISTDSGPYFVEYVDGKWQPSGLVAIPHMFFRPTQMRTFSASVPARTLSGTYSHWSGNLTDDDKKLITSDLIDLYSSSVAEASAAGYFCQPVVARYRLFDHDGAVLYSSAPVLVSPEGFQAVEPVTVHVADKALVDAYALSIKAYRVAISVESLLESQWASRVASMQICLSPQLHPVDFSASVDYRLQAETDADTLLLYFPGTSQGLIPASDARRSMVVAAADRLDNADISTIISYPFVEGLDALEPIRHDALRTPRDEVARLKKLLAASPKVVDATPPFSFHKAHAVGDMILFGDISFLRPLPHPLAEFIADYDAAPWHGCIAVRMADGTEQVVWSGQALDFAPLKLSPLLSYPSAEARTIYISILYADGTHREATFPLTPSPVADVAYYVDSSLAPMELPLSDSSFYVPPAVTVEHRYRGRILAAAITSPLEPFASIEVAAGAVTAITSAVRSSSSWDFGRAHLYIFSTSGIYALAVTRAHALASCQLLDHRPVISAQAVAPTPVGVIAVAGTDLVRIAASRVETLLHAVPIRAVCYNSAFDELLCIDCDGSMTVRRLDSDYTYRRSITPLAFYNDATAHCLTDDGSLLDMSLEMPASAVAIYWTHRMSLSPYAPRKVPRVALASWRLFASEASLELSLRGDHGGNTPLPLVSVDVDGEINASVPVRVIAPPRRYISLSVDGSVSADFNFEDIQLLLSNS